MKIMLISFPCLPVCQNLLYLAYETMKEEKYEVKTIGGETESYNKETCTHDNYFVKTVKKSGMSLGGLLIMPFRIFKVISIIEKEKPNIIHFTHKHIWNYVIIKLLRMIDKSIRIVHTIHDPIGHDGDKVKAGVVKYNTKITKLADGLIVHSENARKQLIDNYKFDAVVGLANLAHTRWNEYKERNITKEVLFFGRINYYKGCDMIPDLAKYLQEINSEITIHIVGKAADEISSDLIDRINSNKNVVWDNRFIEDSEIDGFFDTSSAVLIMYKHITQSGVILDAYNNSLPVIAFDIDGVGEFVSDGETGMLVEPFDVKAYANKIHEILNDVEKWNEIRKKAWEFGSDRYSSVNMVRAFVALYKNTLK